MKELKLHKGKLCMVNKASVFKACASHLECKF